MSVTIYHNPSCSKSRAALSLLEKQGITPNIRLYLKQPLDAKELNHLLHLLSFDSPRDLMRHGENLYKEQKLSDAKLTHADLVAAMIQHPKLIERPIVATDVAARIGRPPENILALFE